MRLGNSAWAAPIIDANGDGVGKYGIFQLDSYGNYTSVGKWSGDSLKLDILAVRKGLQAGPLPLSVCR